jgi:hypothetical protein
MYSRDTPQTDHNCIIRYGLRGRPDLVSAPPSVPIEANKASRPVVTTHVFGSVASDDPPTRRVFAPRTDVFCMANGPRRDAVGPRLQSPVPRARSAGIGSPSDTCTRNLALMEYGSWKSGVRGNRQRSGGGGRAAESSSLGWQLYCHPTRTRRIQGRQCNCHPNGRRNPWSVGGMRGAFPMILWHRADSRLPPNVGMAGATECKKKAGIDLLFPVCDVLIKTNHTHEGAP